MTGRRRVVLVEDHTLLAQSLGFALRAEGFQVEVADLTDAASLVRSVAADSDTVVLLDLELGGTVGDSTPLIPRLVAGGAIVVVVSGVRDRMRLAATLQAGAIGFLAKDAPYDVLLRAVIAAAAGRPVVQEADRLQLLADLRRHRAAERAERAPFDALTPREQEVLHQLVAGHSVDSIARDWVVSPATVRTQVRGVLTKLDVNSQLAAVAKARAAGWSP